MIETETERNRRLAVVEAHYARQDEMLTDVRFALHQLAAALLKHNLPNDGLTVRVPSDTYLVLRGAAPAQYQTAAGRAFGLVIDGVKIEETDR